MNRTRNKPKECERPLGQAGSAPPARGYASISPIARAENVSALIDSLQSLTAAQKVKILTIARASIKNQDVTSAASARAITPQEEDARDDLPSTLGLNATSSNLSSYTPSHTGGPGPSRSLKYAISAPGSASVSGNARGVRRAEKKKTALSFSKFFSCFH